MTNNFKEINHILKHIIDLDASLISEFSNFFKPREYSKNEYFLKEGQPINKLGFILNGVARLYNMDELGNEATIYLLSEENFVVGSFVPEKKSDVTIQFITDSTILIAEYDELLAFMESNNKLKHFFEGYLSMVHKRILSRLSQYLRLTAKDRYLLFLKEYPNIINRIPHYYIANYLGISSTQLSRIRHKLAKE